MKPELILIGAGGHCRSCIEVIESSGIFTIRGLLDTAGKKGGSVLGYQIIGSDDMIELLVSAGCQFLITIGQIDSPEKRKIIYKTLI